MTARLTCLILGAYEIDQVIKEACDARKQQGCSSPYLESGP